MTIPVYALPWHLHQSSAMRELLNLPLSPYLQFEQRTWDGDGDLPELQKNGLKSGPIVFFMMPPPEGISRHSNAQMIWIPMWDQAHGYDHSWWSRLPKNLRVVSFSNEISKRSKSVGLNTLDVRYSMLPVDGEEANWDQPRTLLYWNRTGMVGSAFLRSLCRALDVEVLLFRRNIDPRQPSWCDYTLPEKLGKTVVRELTVAHDRIDARQSYLNCLNQANIFIAPRLSEGVGLSFIEALAKGCAVLAYDAPTMNEYISHKINGYLLNNLYPTIFNRWQGQAFKLLGRVARRFGVQNFSFEYPVTEWQNWAEINKLDLQSLGKHARQAQIEGYAAWKNILPQFASFILDW